MPSEVGQSGGRMAAAGSWPRPTEEATGSHSGPLPAEHWRKPRSSMRATAGLWATEERFCASYPTEGRTGPSLRRVVSDAVTDALARVTSALPGGGEARPGQV